MKLAALMSERAGRTATAHWDPSFGDLDIAGLSADSRQVAQGYLFAALPGARLDGRRFIPDALDAGAAAILSTTDVTRDSLDGGGAALITDPQPRRQLAWMADRFFDAQPATQVAVTGTNGKTSVVSFLQQIWSAAGRRAAALGTLGISGPGVERPGALTTPDPVSLHRDLAALKRSGIECLAIEASSHGLDQFRLDGLRLKAAAFTGFGRDHIDYHGSTDAYLAAKLRLFAELVPAGGTAVINADSPAHEEIRRACDRANLRVVGYGRAAEEIVLRSLTPVSGGQRLELTVFGQATTVELPLAGDFQAWNALCALGLATATGVEASVGLDALKRLHGAPGRMELVGSRRNGAAVYVDYAHTPDALETVLKALRPHTKGALAVVFGCGGDRDAGKRPLMGAAAHKFADRAIVTDDNPRGEAPSEIRAAVLPACPGAAEIGDRREAIFAAVSDLAPADTLVIAGKGHEQGQIVGDSALPFDDAAVAREAIAAADASGDGAA
ncbi:MAG: UDP-N-acetylmuramoyl-L-alanyl-D-glutamate--2,6-diaminopimelate ligase [Rhodospirillaceae bacterium]|nr:UDP-N-acetylmuramoyl-L-alanyl-D-glutamate--2,6-diaminopimelate ligase [Rhodospirillaceae bacterium]MYH36954.1 UDP-N-acetylmuramoyl-L-alanyl-D-glutamate--2,6-diaminopimelate ligase [Rhodospirillaceae bacterium]MYK57157.1 UDP-N-acetylmuramoyl-L-alanyl-D-glutamate--2,6-diaminopimelate ligase [Rhodospirillaceae bacterium]